MSRQVGADNVIIVLASVGQCGHAWPGGDAVVVVDTGHVYPAVPSCTQCAAPISRLYPDTALSISRACMKVCHQDNAVCSDDLWLIFYCFSGNYTHFHFSATAKLLLLLPFGFWIQKTPGPGESTVQILVEICHNFIYSVASVCP